MDVLHIHIGVDHILFLVSILMHNVVSFIFADASIKSTPAIYQLVKGWTMCVCLLHFSINSKDIRNKLRSTLISILSNIYSLLHLKKSKRYVNVMWDILYHFERSIVNTSFIIFETIYIRVVNNKGSVFKRSVAYMYRSSLNYIPLIQFNSN